MAHPLTALENDYNPIQPPFLLSVYFSMNSGLPANAPSIGFLTGRMDGGASVRMSQSKFVKTGMVYFSTLICISSLLVFFFFRFFLLTITTRIFQTTSTDNIRSVIFIKI